LQRLPDGERIGGGQSGQERGVREQRDDGHGCPSVNTVHDNG
jgi:hypothetical protein